MPIILAAPPARVFLGDVIEQGSARASSWFAAAVPDGQLLKHVRDRQAAFLRNCDFGYSYADAASSSSKVVGKVGVAPLPRFPGQSYPGNSNIGGWNLCIIPHSKNVAVGLTFIKWMMSPVVQRFSPRGSRRSPPSSRYGPRQLP